MIKMSAFVFGKQINANISVIEVHVYLTRILLLCVNIKTISQHNTLLFSNAK